MQIVGLPPPDRGAAGGVGKRSVHGHENAVVLGQQPCFMLHMFVDANSLAVKMNFFQTIVAASAFAWTAVWKSQTRSAPSTSAKLGASALPLACT